MKIFMPTRGHLPRITTPRLFDSGDLTFIVHRLEDRTYLERHFRNKIMVAHVSKDRPRGGALSAMRNFAMGLLRPGEWCGMVDDDLVKITGPQSVLRREHYDAGRLDFECYPNGRPSVMAKEEWKEAFQQETIVPAYLIMDDLVTKCEEVGTVFGGIAGHDNYFFKGIRWSTQGLVISRFCVVRQDGHRWLPSMCHDVERTCHALAAYGATVIDKWFYPICKEDYPEFGIGTVESRREEWMRVTAMIDEKYPGLLRLEWPLAKIIPNTRPRFEKWWRELRASVDPLEFKRLYMGTV